MTLQAINRPNWVAHNAIRYAKYRPRRVVLVGARDISIMAGKTNSVMYQTWSENDIVEWCTKGV